MCITRRRGAHTAHTQTDGLHTRHPLERTHTNTHNDTYNCTKKRTYVHGVKHVGAGQEQHRRLCIRFHYGTRLAFHWRLQRPPRPIAISGGKLLKSPLRRDTWTSFVLQGGLLSAVDVRSYFPNPTTTQLSCDTEITSSSERRVGQEGCCVVDVVAMTRVRAVSARRTFGGHHRHEAEARANVGRCPAR